MLGSLGSIVFECSEQHVMTFSGLSFSRQANFAEHKIIGKNGLAEFTGFNADTCSMKMVFDASQGISPLDALNELRQMYRDYEANLFVLDGQLVGAGYWVIESLDETLELFTSQGRCTRAEVNLRLKEYNEE